METPDCCGTSTTWTTWWTASCAPGGGRRPAGVWNLGSPPVRLREFAEAVFRALGEEPRVRAPRRSPAGFEAIAIGDFHSGLVGDPGRSGGGEPAWTPRIRPRRDGARHAFHDAMKIPFQRLAVDADPGVRQAVERVLASGRFVPGSGSGEAFERAFAALDRRRAQPWEWPRARTPSRWRSLPAGIGPGDRVLTAAFSTGYTAIGIRHAGATPVFADVEPESLCLDAGAVGPGDRGTGHPGDRSGAPLRRRGRRLGDAARDRGPPPGPP